MDLVAPARHPAWLAWCAILLLAIPATGIATPLITTVAGRGDQYALPDGDGGPAVEANFRFIEDVAVGSSGVLYIVDDSGSQVRSVDADGVVHPVTGGGVAQEPVDGALAIDVQLLGIQGIHAVADGSLYVATRYHGVFRIDPDGRIREVAPDVAAFDVDVVMDGSVFIADADGHRVLKVSPSGETVIVAGTGEPGNGGDGGHALQAELDYPTRVVAGANGELFIATRDRVRKVLLDGTITTYAGGGTDPAGSTASSVLMIRIDGLALDREGRLYVSDVAQNLVRAVHPDGRTEIVVGAVTGGASPAPGFGGDGGPAGEARLANPRGLAIRDRTLYIADYANFRVRAVAPIEGPAAPADFNGDGVSDIVWRHSLDGHDQVWLAARSGDRQQMRAVRNPEWDIVSTGDYDGDGISDVFWRNVRTGANALWPAATPARTPVRGVTNGEWLVEAAGDFDGDGRNDLFWRNMITGVNAIWPGGHPGDVSVVAIRNAAWHVAGAGDFDGDGQSDVLWRNPDTGANVIWHSALYATQQVLPPMTGAAWTVAGIGDFGGDGLDDVLWRNYDTGENVLWPAANAAHAITVATVAKTSWIVAAVGDYDGDGDADVLWRDRASGRNVIWRDGDHREQRAVGSVADQQWQVVPESPVECGVRRAQWAVGMAYSPDLLGKIRWAVRARSAVARFPGTFWAPVVVPSRVTVVVGDDNRVDTVSCQ